MTKQELADKIEQIEIDKIWHFNHLENESDPIDRHEIKRQIVRLNSIKSQLISRHRSLL